MSRVEQVTQEFLQQWGYNPQYVEEMLAFGSDFRHEVTNFLNRLAEAHQEDFYENNKE